VATKGTGVLETFRLVSQMLLERVTKDLKRSPGAGGGREVPRPAPAAPAPPPTISASPSFAPAPSPPPPVRPVAPPPQAPTPSQITQSPFTTTRGEFGTQHPAAERAERTAAAPPPARTFQRETPSSGAGSGNESGFFQRDLVVPVEPRSTPVHAPVQAPASPPPAAPARPQGSETVVVPIRLDGNVREIVLRIVIEQPAEQRR